MPVNLVPVDPAPDEPRIDSHQHCWRLDRGDYGWLTKQLAAIYRDFTPADLQPLINATNIKKTVLVQAAPSVAETKYLLSLAAEQDFIAGVVGWVDMADAHVTDTLNQLTKSPWLKGIRPMIQDITDPAWMLKPELDRAFQWLVEQQLCFDALVTPVHLPHLLTLLQRYPALKVVIDHGAKPDIAHNGFEQWAPGIRAIATQTTASCKLSGLLTEAAPGADFDNLQPYMQTLLDCFGTERLLWGSDWPVLNLASNYSDWLAITERFISTLDNREQALIMGANSTRFYNLQ